MSLRKRALLVTGPTTVASDALLDVRQRLGELSFEVVERPANGRQAVLDAIDEHRLHLDLVIAAGGDGMVNAAVQKLAETDLPLAIVPLGTANVLARTVGVTLASACNVIAGGHVRSIDLACVNGIYFCNVASLGVTVAISRSVSPAAKKRFGVLAYGATALKALMPPSPFRASITANGKTVRTTTLQISVANGRYYGGGMRLPGESLIDDGQLHVLSLELRKWRDVISCLKALTDAPGPATAGVRCISTSQVEIRTGRPHPIDTDGELTTATPGQFRVIPGALRICAPLSLEN